MPTIGDLLSSLENVLPVSATTTYHAGGAVNDAYEGYLWSEVIRIAKAESPPWRITYQNAGPTNSDFVFRRSPGSIYSNRNYTYAELARGAKKLELHLGIKILGQSGVAHEFDVVLLTKGAADVARTLRRDPERNGVRLHIEAKFYNSELSLGIARSLVGLAKECDVKAHLVSPGSAPDSVRALLRHYKSVYLHDVAPGRPGPSYLESCVQAALRHS